MRNNSTIADVKKRNRPARHDRMFRASASAFSCITRPTRNQAKQFEEIALSLYDHISSDTLRYVGALLSNDANAPKSLVMRIAREPVSLSAPLLLRSPVLATADLVLLISHGGVPHAQTIAQRPGLDPTLKDLLAILSRRAVPDANQPAEVNGDSDKRQSLSAKSVRDQLRVTLAANETSGIRPVEHASARPSPDPERLVDAALANAPSALIDELVRQTLISKTLVSDLLAAPGYLHLVMMLKGLQLNTGDAFLIVSAASPTSLYGKDTVRLFFERYRSLDPQAAKDRLSDWRSQSASFGDRRRSSVSFTVRRSVEPDDTPIQIAMAS